MLWAYDMQLLQAEWCIIRMSQHNAAIWPVRTIDALIMSEQVFRAEICGGMFGIPVLTPITANDIQQ